MGNEMSKPFDIIVIGAGPGGYIAAIRAAQLGFSVACIDEWKNEKGGPAPGGTCTNVGCIPSKALLQSSEHFEHAGHGFAEHGIEVKGLKLNLGQMLGRKDTVVKQNNDGILYLFKKNKVSFFHGRGAFTKVDAEGYEISVTGKDKETLKAKHIIIATGSNPRELPGAAFDEKLILSNTGALAIEAVPKKLGLIGAGVIGLEMEGAYYQKAIQSASKIRKSINPDVKVRYAYYASDNPLETGSTLASGGLGTTGVKPTYLITIKILEQIFNVN
jgi:dihydrolipoamide dehydrogenase